MKKPEDDQSQVDHILESKKYPDVSIRDLWLFGKYASELWKRHGQDRYGFREFVGEGRSHASFTKIIDGLEKASGKELAAKGATRAKKRTGYLTEDGNVWAAFAHLVAALYEIAMAESLTDRDKAGFMFSMARSARAKTDPEADWKYYSQRR